MARSRREFFEGALRLAAAATLLPRSMRAAPVSVHRPYLQDVRTDRATIVWSTKERGAAAVEYSADAGFANAVRIEARSREYFPQLGLSSAFVQHSAQIRGLSPNTQYFYRVLVDGENLGSASLRTAVVTGSFRFVAIGDSGVDSAEQGALRRRMQTEQAAFLMHTGDIAYPSATFETFQLVYLNSYAELMRDIPFFPCPGNHDVELDRGASYRALHPLPFANTRDPEQGMYYSFDWGDARFISLDSNLMSNKAAADAMLAWLEGDLANTRKPWKIVFWHHAPYDISRGSEPETQQSRERIIPVLERYGVQLVLCGHNHIYMRSRPLVRGRAVQTGGRGIVFVTTGGGGAGLYDAPEDPETERREVVHHYVRVDVSAARIQVRAIAVNGREIDNFTIAPLPQVTENSVVNAASFTPPVAPGSIVSIFGSNLAFEQRQAEAFPLPTEIAGVSVSLNERRLPLFFVSPGQINAQVPFDITGAVTLRVTNPNGSTELPFRLADVSPGIFAIVRSDGVVASPSAPLQPGEFITIFATGLGRVQGSVGAGQPVPASPLFPVAAPVDVLLNNTGLPSLFAGLTPGLAGLYQVNAQIPGNATVGTVQLRVSSNGTHSNALTVSVR